MDYKQAMDFLQKGHVFGLDSISLNAFRQYMNDKHNFQRQLKCIHVTGTNGKGSTSYAMEQILMEAGYRIGVYSSPCIESDFDSIRVNGKTISKEKYETYIDEYFEEWKDYGLSSFEADVFVSFLYFLEKKVDFVIYEVGMGGIDDATNVIDSILSIITNIGLDHCDYLGNTYEEIALKKAGIVKNHSMLITGERKQACIDVFKNICHQKQSRFRLAQEGNGFVDSCLHLDALSYHDIQVPTLALYQIQNLSLAIQALEWLKENHILTFDEMDIRKGLSHFHWKGRFEIVSQDPFIVLDGAHNVEGIKEVVRSCRNISNLKVLFSALKDKPYDAMLTELEKISNSIYVCEFEHIRKANVQCFFNHNVTFVSDYEDFIQKNRDSLLICGSLYFISRVRKCIMERL